MDIHTKMRSKRDEDRHEMPVNDAVAETLYCDDQNSQLYIFLMGHSIMKKALKPCNEPGCPSLTREGYCEQHKRIKSYDQYRESAAKRGITASGGRRALATCPSIRYVLPA